MSHIKYRPEIDGLRAVAVIPVILFHLGYSWIHGGFVGVDVFFVISGYLITLIILREQEQGAFTFRNFWLRRARRILPALASMILACMIAGFFILFRFDWKALGEQGLSVFALVANFKMWRMTSNYWAPAAHETPLLHTWSLAVEEQFYLFYPLILITILKFAKKHTFKLILTVTILSFLLGLIATQYKPGAAFYLLPPRAWELAAGCLLALLTHERPFKFKENRHASKFAGIGALTIIISYFCISEDRGFPGYQALFPVVGSLLVIAFASTGEFTGRILAAAPICYLGKISYSLYLWHWPVIVYAQTLHQQTSTVIPIVVIAGITVFLSVISYHLIEKSTRTSKNWAIPVSLLAIISIAASAAMYAWPVHYDFSNFKQVVWNGRLYDVTPNQQAAQELLKERMAGITAPMRQGNSRAFAERGIIKEYGGPKPEVIVFGDSHALMWSSVIDSICKELKYSVSFFAADGTSPDIPVPLQTKATRFFNGEEKYLLDRARFQILNEEKPKLVILSSKYSGLSHGQNLESLIGLISQSGAKCLMIEQPPMMPFGDRNALIYCAEIARKNGNASELILPIGEPGNWQYGRSIIENSLKKFPSASILNIANLYLKSENQVILMKEGNVLYIDDDHLSDYGASIARPIIKEAIFNSVK